MLRKKRHNEAEIASKLSEAENLATEGQTQDQIAQALGISVMTFHRWRKAQSHLRSSSEPSASHSDKLVPLPHRIDPSRQGRVAELQLENARLRKLVTDLLLEKMRLEEESEQPSHHISARKG